jgi:hypothetical protein
MHKRGRILAVLVVIGGLATGARSARADGPVAAPGAPYGAPPAPYGAPPAPYGMPPLAEPAPTVTTYGFQIVAADVLALALGAAADSHWNSPNLLLGAWLLASPTVHVVHGDYGAAVASLGLHIGLPLLGFALGYETAGCGSNNDAFLCGAGQGLAGMGIGMVVATVIDATQLARHTEAPAAGSTASSGRASSTLAFSVGRNGDVSVGVVGRF